MKTYKVNAIIVGALFIITMIAGIIESNLIAPVLQGSLNAVYPNELLVKTGVLLILVMSIGIVGIAIILFPVLKKQNETIAVTYVGFRAIECVFYLIGAIASLVLITLSQNYITAAAPDASYFQTISNLAITVRNSAYQIALCILGFGSSLMFGYLLYRSKLIPKWLSAWGLIGYALLLVSALLDILGIIDTVHGLGMMLYIPGGLFEVIAFPLWLIVKGFNTSEIACVK
jgi:hypothetical protein